MKGLFFIYIQNLSKIGDIEELMILRNIMCFDIMKKQIINILIEGITQNYKHK